MYINNYKKDVKLKWQIHYGGSIQVKQKPAIVAANPP